MIRNSSAGIRPGKKFTNKIITPYQIKLGMAAFCFFTNFSSLKFLPLRSARARAFLTFNSRNLSSILFIRTIYHHHLQKPRSNYIPIRWISNWGSCLNAFPLNAGYFNKTIFLVCTNWPALI